MRMDFGTSVELWICFYVGIVLSTVMGNVLILISIFKHSKLRDNMYLLIGNLAVSDLLVGIVLVPYYLLIDGGRFESGHGVIPLNKFTCLGRPCIYVCCLGSSCISLLLISLERFLTLRFPLRAKIFITRRRLFYAIGVSWAIVFINGTLPLYGWSSYDETNHTCVSDEIITQEYKLLINWELITCLVVNFILYTSAVRIAYQHATDWRRRNSSCVVNQRTGVETELHTIVTTVIVFGAFFLCWLPYIGAAIALTVNENPVTQSIRRWALIPGFLNSGINWLIYGYRNSFFKASFKSILTGRRIQRDGDRQASLPFGGSCKTITKV